MFAVEIADERGQVKIVAFDVYMQTVVHSVRTSSPGQTCHHINASLQSPSLNALWNGAVT
jgi:hypothetical protein